MISSVINRLLPLFVMIAFVACKKNQGESLDYNLIAEQRILEVSEQPSISEDDIAALERLLENVTNAAVLSKLEKWLESVKIIKGFIPVFEVLRTDPDVNFPEEYARLEHMLGTITDELPRKAKLKEALEKANENYNTEEYEYSDIAIGEQSNLRTFLKEAYDIEHVPGKNNRFYKTDIDKVDSLRLSIHFLSNTAGTVPAVLKTFKNLKYLYTGSTVDEVLDLNQHTKLETLEIGYEKELKIEQCQLLKRLNISKGEWGEVLDFTDKYPLLESLVLPKNITDNLVTILLPAKQHLNEVLPGTTQLPKIKRLVIEGNQISQLSILLGSASNREVEEVRIAGLGGTAPDGFATTILGLSGYYDQSTDNYVTVKNIALSRIGSGYFGLSNLKLNNSLDFAAFTGSIEEMNLRYVDFYEIPGFEKLQLNQLGVVDIEGISVKGEACGFNDVKALVENASEDKLSRLFIALLKDYPEKRINLAKFKKLTRVGLTTASASGQLLEKVILNKSVESLFRFFHRNPDGVAQPTVLLEYVD